jgi:23S rRNA pseudouridine1911/1915/1917 synthase
MSEEIIVIFEDNHQLVLNKPAGLLTQPSGTDQDSLEAQAKAWLKQKYQKSGNVFLEAVHRIDKPVSGIVLFAKTSKGLTRLNESLRDKKSHKVYLTLVEGIVKSDKGTLENYLVHDDFSARVVAKSDPQAKLAVLHYKVIERFSNQTRLEIILETGRYHQIRVQLSAMGHPILGDKKYASRVPFKNDAIALHHYRLQVPHPTTGELQTFEAPWNL